MTRRNNPLTARVMVNRIWLHLFSEGIVRTPENFGATGLRPTHPELLDWLAIEFMNNDWSVKQMVRQIVTSRTYRMSSQFDQEKFERDPENLYLWRAAPRQLDAEALRDAMLSVSGTIDRNRPRGSLVAEAGLTVVRDGKLTSFVTDWSGSSESMSANRIRGQRSDARPRLKQIEIDQIQRVRSVYLPIVRENLPRALEVFDFAEPGLVVGKREASNTPAQGLYLLNNEFVRQQSHWLAQRLINEADNATERIDLAFQLAYARTATPPEMQAAEQFLDEFPARRSFRQGGATVQENRLVALAQAILASAEFRYTD